MSILLLDGELKLYPNSCNQNTPASSRSERMSEQNSYPTRSALLSKSKRERAHGHAELVGTVNLTSHLIFCSTWKERGPPRRAEKVKMPPPPLHCCIASHWAGCMFLYFVVLIMRYRGFEGMKKPGSFPNEPLGTVVPGRSVE